MKLICADAGSILNSFEDESFQSVITSPPYYNMRDYGIDGQIGNESSYNEYINSLLKVFGEVKRVLKEDGVFWLNIGDCYMGSGGMGSQMDNRSRKGLKKIKRYHRNGNVDCVPKKSIICIPWRLAIAMVEEQGWILRTDIVWNKPNCMPESVKDRPTRSHEYLFMFTKSQRYYYDHKVVMEDAAYDGRKDETYKGSDKYKDTKYAQGIAIDGRKRWPNCIDGKRKRNKRTVWTIPTKPYTGAHFAVFPEKLIEPCILSSTQKGDMVLDPFMGVGTVGIVANSNERRFVGIDINPEYVDMAWKRLLK